MLSASMTQTGEISPPEEIGRAVHAETPDSRARVRRFIPLLSDYSERRLLKESPTKRWSIGIGRVVVTTINVDPLVLRYGRPHNRRVAINVHIAGCRANWLSRLASEHCLCLLLISTPLNNNVESVAGLH